jgi:hypothetical protein
MIGGLPPGVAGTDALFSTMAIVTGYADKATAESGIGAQPGNSQRTSGTLTYWTGLSYTDLDLRTAAAGTVTMADVVASYPIAGGGSYVISLTGKVDIGSSAVAPSGTAPCLTVACTVTSTTGSVIATVVYDIWRTDAAGIQSPVAKFAVTLDLGSALAKTSYRAAPSA